MSTINVNFEVTPGKAFEILCKSLEVELLENPVFKLDENNEIVVYCRNKFFNQDEIYDDRGELYLALYHLATKMIPNTENRHLFEDPNTLMGELYLDKEGLNE